MHHFHELVEDVKTKFLPEARALSTANTLQQLSRFIPTGVTLADLAVGWRILSHLPADAEEPAVTGRRMTCGELATLASQFTSDQGNLKQAIKAWQSWRDAFAQSDDPRQAAMAKTFERELSELEEVSR